MDRRRVRFLLSVLAGLLLGWAGWLLAGTNIGAWLAEQVQIVKELRSLVGVGIGFILAALLVLGGAGSG